MNKLSPGFTLIEVIASLAILVLLVTTIFSIIGGTLASGSLIFHSHNRQQEINGLYRLIGTNLRSLPIRATLRYGPDESISNVSAVLRISNAPRAFAWGPQAEGLFDVILSATKQQGSGLTLGLARLLHNRENNSEIRWLPLLRDIKFIEWRFFDGRTKTWYKTWLDTSYRPSLIELQIVLLDNPDEPFKMVFWLPPVHI